MEERGGERTRFEEGVGEARFSFREERRGEVGDGVLPEGGDMREKSIESSRGEVGEDSLGRRGRKSEKGKRKEGGRREKGKEEGRKPLQELKLGEQG